MPRRNFLPPAVCDTCNERPALGDSLFHNDLGWLCPACLADKTPGVDLATKTASQSLRSQKIRALSVRNRVAGNIETANSQLRQSNWHGHAAASLKSHGNRMANSALIASGEAAMSPGHFKDTLAEPNLIAVESSEMRGKLLLSNDVVALGIDVSNTIEASNTLEKLLAHEIALSHKIALEQAAIATCEPNPAMAIKHFQVSARMMTVFQQGVLTLQKLRTGGTQNMVVQHVYVADGAQAVVGTVQTGSCTQDEK